MTMLTVDKAYFARWTIAGPDLDPDGSGAYLIEIAELPGFLVAGASKEEAIREFGPALRAHLAAYAESGKPLPAATGNAGWLPGQRQTPIAAPQVSHLIPDGSFALA